MPLLRTLMYYAFQRAAADPAVREKAKRVLREDVGPRVNDVVQDEIRPRLRTIRRELGPRIRAVRAALRERRGTGE